MADIHDEIKKLEQEGEQKAAVEVEQQINRRLGIPSNSGGTASSPQTGKNQTTT